MKTPLLRLATTVVRAWTDVYTLGLPQAERTARRAEIDSDLWEFEHDPEAPQGRSAAAQVFARLMIGIPADLAWRMAAGANGHRAPVRVLAAAGVMTGPRRVSAFGLAATIHVVAISGVMWLASVGPGASPNPGRAARGRGGIEHRLPPNSSSRNQRVRQARTHESVVRTPVQSAATPKKRAFGVVHEIARAVAVRAGLIAPPRLTAQTPPSASGPVVEVASIEPNHAGRDAPTWARIQPGGPRWIWSDASGIDAKTEVKLLPAGGGRPFQGALPGMLADRFKLFVHTETRQRSIYALVLAHGDGHLGPNLTRSSRTDCDAILARVTTEQAQEPSNPSPLPPWGGAPPPCGAMNGPGTFAFDSGTLAQLADHLSAELNTKVVDRTDLMGLFNARLTWTADQSIFTAVQEQLGLNLQKTIGLVDVLTVDRVERPTKN